MHIEKNSMILYAESKDQKQHVFDFTRTAYRTYPNMDPY